jgi:hypothetical protein
MTSPHSRKQHEIARHRFSCDEESYKDTADECLAAVRE